MAVREFSVVTAIETAALAALEPYELEPVIPPNGIPELKVRLYRCGFYGPSTRLGPPVWSPPPRMTHTSKHRTLMISPP